MDNNRLVEEIPNSNNVYTRYIQCLFNEKGLVALFQNFIIMKQLVKVSAFWFMCSVFYIFTTVVGVFCEHLLVIIISVVLAAGFGCVGVGVALGVLKRRGKGK